MSLPLLRSEESNHVNRSSTGPLSMRLLTVLMVGLSVVALPDTDAAAAEKKSSGSSHDWRLHGRLQIDGAQYDSDNPLYVDDAALRRARLALLGDLWAGWRMKLEVEFSGSTPGPKSVYLRHDIGESGAFTLGHFKESISLQTATSSRYNTFMERALPNVDSPGYRLGAAFAGYGKIWSATAGVTGGRLNDQYKIDDDGTGVFFRAVLNPATSKKRLWHFGIGSEVRKYDTTDSVRLRSRPESDLTDIRLVDTTTLSDLDQGFRYTAEFAWKLKAVHLQAEYLNLTLSRNNNASDLDFNGWYAQAGWFITGETRNYNRTKGAFGLTKPRHSYGAWEVAVRVSELDLNSAEIAGGKESNLGLALNWYATDGIRVSLNYIDASARPSALGVDDDVSIIQARFQYIF